MSGEAVVYRSEYGIGVELNPVNGTYFQFAFTAAITQMSPRYHIFRCNFTEMEHGGGGRQA